MFCTSCGHEIAGESAFCSSCGRAVAAEKKPQAVTTYSVPQAQKPLNTDNVDINLMSRMNADQRGMFQYQMNAVRKAPGTALLLSFFCLSRFYLEQAMLGVLQVLLSFALVGLVWAFIDIFTARSRTDEYNRTKALGIAAALGVTSNQPGVPQASGCPRLRCAECGKYLPDNSKEGQMYESCAVIFV
jgi:TM2 domain-containing membrane protein YozV